MAGRYPVRNQANPARVIEGEAFIVTPEDSLLHTLNDVGTFIWEQADGRRSIEDIAALLCQTYRVEPDQARRDTETFIEACLRKQVMLLRETPLEPSAP